uniref:Uncharacterized protein n=1 Tax=Oryza glumipatula TaxID=40148 RepID=A0A0E0A466_9ORYZ
MNEIRATLQLVSEGTGCLLQQMQPATQQTHLALGAGTTSGHCRWGPRSPRAHLSVRLTWEGGGRLPRHARDRSVDAVHRGPGVGPSGGVRWTRCRKEGGASASFVVTVRR